MSQTLTQIRDLLAAHGLHPKKRFGQNFLHDGNQMQRILAAAELEKDDLVLEVGPGTGALTCRMLEAKARVVAVEVDHDFEPILREQCAGHDDTFSLLIADVLASKHRINPAVFEALRSMAQAARGSRGSAEDDPSFKLVANLPYQVASPLLATLVTDHPQMTHAVVMIQNEVADRLLAGPGTKAYGPLGILIQAMCEVKRVATLSPGCFWPSPDVESAVISLTRRQTPLVDDARGFGEFVRRVFGRRRKQLGSILGRDRSFPDGITVQMRPEQLSLEQLAALGRLFS